MNETSYDTIYLSPHFDDVVLSCGGQIYQQTQEGHRVLIVTVAAGEPQTSVRSAFAEYLHDYWQLPSLEAVSVRRMEDANACRHLGAEFRHWSLPDTIYRVHPETGQPLYTSNEAIFGDIHPLETKLVQVIADMLEQLPPTQHLVSPLSVGNHVDHQLTRLAAEQLYGDKLLYYEDYPYVQNSPQALQLLLQADTWHSHVISLSAEAIKARIGAILHYRSQIAGLFKNGKTLQESLYEYVEHVGGERLWMKQPLQANVMPGIR